MSLLLLVVGCVHRPPQVAPIDPIAEQQARAEGSWGVLYQ
jgi:hypothetical protein